MNLHVRKPSYEHGPLLVGRQLLQERAMGDPQVFQGGELPQLVHLGPVLDLGGGDVEGLQAGRQLRQRVRRGKLGHRAFCEG